MALELAMAGSPRTTLPYSPYFALQSPKGGSGGVKTLQLRNSKTIVCPSSSHLRHRPRFSTTAGIYLRSGSELLVNDARKRPESSSKECRPTSTPDEISRFRQEVADLRCAEDENNVYACDGMVALSEVTLDRFCLRCSTPAKHAADTSAFRCDCSKGMTCSVVLGACSNGYKLPATIIANYPNGKESSTQRNQFVRLPNNVNLLCNDVGRSTSTERHWILENVYLPADRQDDPRRILLLPGGWQPLHAKSEAFLQECCRTDVVIAPDECLPLSPRSASSSTSPSGVERSFKTAMECEFDQCSGKSVGSGQSRSALSHLQQLIYCVAKAWKDVSEAVISEDFTRCGVGNSFDGEESVCRKSEPDARAEAEK